MEISLEIHFKGQSYPLSLPEDSTLSELRDRIQILTSITPQSQKLLSKALSKIANTSENNSLSLKQLQIASNTNIAVVGSTQEDIEKIHARDERLKNRTPLKPAKPYQDPRDLSAVYEFGSIDILKHQKYIQQDRAMQLMRELSQDLGIKAIMKQYRWNVGKLIEICPHEQPAILGYNRNMGQVIALRLRTDDLSGFRAYNVIRKTLLHELTHMVHSEHDNDFWSLNRVLNFSRNWTKAGGHSVSNRSFASDGSGPVSGYEYKAGTYVLGGSESSSGSLPQRDLLAKAAEIRISQEEREAMLQCGSAKK